MVYTTFKCPHCNAVSTHKIACGNGDHVLLICDNCDKIVYVMLKHVPQEHGGAVPAIADMYPKRTPKTDIAIPRNVADDYIEAVKCFDVGAHRASVVMCRRALQSSAIDRGAKKERLADQINELFQRGIITKELEDWSHEIRLSGNIGAHPNEDGLQDVVKDDTEEIIAFLEEFLNYVYIMPSRVSSRREKRKGESQ